MGQHQTHRDATYQKVFDLRKRPVRGLWMRNGKFYARLSVEDHETGNKSVRRVPLAVDSVAQAQAELRRLQTKRENNALPILKLTPKFSDYVDKSYLAFYETVKDAKRPRTLETEKGHLNHWKKHLGDTRLDRINKAMINAFIAKRQGAKKNARTVNLGVVVLRNVLRKAIDDGWIKTLPTDNLRPLKWTPKKRELVTFQNIEKLCTAALEVSKNGQQFSDYVLLMAYCGARRSETLRLKWSDVDWQQKQMTVGSDGLAKNHEARVVDFNSKLESHLREMVSRCAPDSDWMFPSPQRGDQDKRAKTFIETLKLARKESGLKMGFHDCRHFFISYCVMSGIDFMTIAKWVGHKDGGILIGKVYGHLSNEHAQRQARRLNFEPTILEKTG